MSWSVQVNDLLYHELFDALDDKFVESYSEPESGVRHQFENARAAGEDMACDGFVERKDRRYNVSLSGHVSQGEDDAVEEFLSVIVTQRKLEPVDQGDPAED